jgi:hypothetical protein
MQLTAVKIHANIILVIKGALFGETQTKEPWQLSLQAETMLMVENTLSTY